MARRSAPGALLTTAASLSVGSDACVTHTVRDSAHCLGGVQLLFPLLARLPAADLPAPPLSEGAAPPAESGTLTDAPRSSEKLLVQLLGLMSQMLWDSAADQHFMLRRHGFGDDSTTTRTNHVHTTSRPGPTSGTPRQPPLQNHAHNT